MMRRLVNWTIAGWGWIRKNRRIRIPTDSGPVRVNVGSGLAVAPGWVHLDGGLHALFSGWPVPFLKGVYRLSESRQWFSLESYLGILKKHRFIHHHLKYGLPFDNGTVDFLYSSHVLEHLSKGDGERLIREARRVLKPGGRIRLAVPDLEKVFLLYKEGRKEKALSYFFVPGAEDSLDRHRTLYDFELLQESLESAGFTGVERCFFRKGSVPDVAILDNRPEETLFVEAAVYPPKM